MSYPGSSYIMSYSLVSPVLLHLFFRGEWGATIIIVSIPETSASFVYAVIMIFQFSFLVLH